MSSPVTSTSKIYDLLVLLLTKSPQTVEVLPGDSSVWVSAYQNPDSVGQSSFSPFLFVEDNLGVPQQILYKIYLHAAGVFKSTRNNISTRPSVMSQRNHDASLVRVLAESSSVLVLANPSHQTALNSRKHLVRIQQIDPHVELRFMASLLSSQHYAKHAELWYHRRWLLSFACDPRFSDASGVDPYCHLHFTSQETLQRELDLASRACELYQRNYFAWAHRLICIQSLLSNYLGGMDTLDFIPIFRNEITRAKEWIDRHVSDYSAIHFILALSQAAFQSGDSSLVETVNKEVLLDHAISLVEDYPTHKALWIYTQATFSISNISQTYRMQQFIDHFVQPLAQLQHPRAGILDDLVKASQCAKQFLDRRVNCQYTSH